jgi:hypothetical protein
VDRSNPGAEVSQAGPQGQSCGPGSNHPQLANLRDLGGVRLTAAEPSRQGSCTAATRPTLAMAPRGEFRCGLRVRSSTSARLARGG